MDGMKGVAGSMPITLKQLQNLIDRIPINEYLHLQVLESGEGYARIRMPYNPVLTTLSNSIHGGALMTLADIAFFAALATLHGTDISTSISIKETTTSFAYPSRDSELYAEGRVVNSTRGETIVVNTDDKLVATSSVLYGQKSACQKPIKLIG